MRNIILLACLAVGASANALIIDDFSTGNINSTISSGTVQNSTAAGVVGGQRYTYHTVLGNPLNLSHSLIVTNGVFVSDSKTMVTASAIGAYGVTASGNFGPDLNLDLSGNDRFRFTFLSNDLPATVTMLVYTNGVGSTLSTAHALTPNMVMTTQTVDIMFSEFSGINFADVDAMAFYIDTTASGDVVLDTFEAVPEPASLIALGLGVAALASRKRKA